MVASPKRPLVANFLAARGISKEPGTRTKVIWFALAPKRVTTSAAGRVVGVQFQRSYRWQIVEHALGT